MTPIATLIIDHCGTLTGRYEHHDMARGGYPMTNTQAFLVAVMSAIAAVGAVIHQIQRFFDKKK